VLQDRGKKDNHQLMI